MTASRGINRPKWRPTDAEIEQVRREFPATKTADLAARLGVARHQVDKLAANLGVRKDPAWLNGPGGGRTDGTKGMGTRFQKGMTPWSKGRKLAGLIPVAETAFKPGHRPANYKPVGSHRIAAGGYLQRKVHDTGYPPRDWVMVHRLVWEQAHGPIPAGHVVAFRPGRRTTVVEEITADALELISQAELMERNRMPPELQKIVQLRSVITRVINQRSKA
ncbi:MAG: HNH endonuclease signature motif containing protein [Burkholderiales bacterium]|jgi:hypothetical protein